jgi:hypothetical protein
MPAQVKEAASAFNSLKKIRTVEGQPAAQAGTKTGSTMGRPLRPGAKSRNPDWRAWTGYLKRETAADADSMLKRNPEEKRDMSELLEDLLAGWLAEQKQKQV